MSTHHGGQGSESGNWAQQGPYDARQYYAGQDPIGFAQYGQPVPGTFGGGPPGGGGNRSNGRFWGRIVPWMRIGFGGLIAVLGILIASMQFEEAANASEREMVRNYRDQAQSCANHLTKFMTESMVAAAQIEREMKELEIPYFVLTPAYMSLDQTGMSLMMCGDAEADFIEEPEGLVADMLFVINAIDSYYLNQETDSGERFDTRFELAEYIADFSSVMSDYYLMDMWAAYMHGPDWREFVDDE